MNYGMTPEERFAQKKRNQVILYTVMFVGTALITALVTMAVSNI